MKSDTIAILALAGMVGTFMAGGVILSAHLNADDIGNIVNGNTNTGIKEHLRSVGVIKCMGTYVDDKNPFAGSKFVGIYIYDNEVNSYGDVYYKFKYNPVFETFDYGNAYDYKHWNITDCAEVARKDVESREK